MIEDERQYRLTRAQVERFSEALSQLRLAAAPSADVHPRLVEAQTQALQSQLDDLAAELIEYLEAQMQTLQSQLDALKAEHCEYESIRSGEPRVASSGR